MSEPLPAGPKPACSLYRNSLPNIAAPCSARCAQPTCGCGAGEDRGGHSRTLIVGGLMMALPNPWATHARVAPPRALPRTISFSRALAPRHVKERGSAGAKRPPSYNPAAFRRPRAAAAVPRVQRHRQRAFGPTRRVLAAGLHRLGPPSCCASQVQLRERRCRRASVQFVAILHSLDLQPRHLRRA